MLGEVDKTYGRVPEDMILQIEKLNRILCDFGPRLLRRRGAGMEFFDTRDFQPESDDPRRINVPLSQRAGRPIVIEKEAEVMQNIYLWRDSTDSMSYSSLNNGQTKKQAAEVMLLALARHLAANEEQIGILGQKEIYRGGKAHQKIAGQLMDVTIVAGDVPVPSRRLPRNSTAVLFGDFHTEPETLARSLDQLKNMGVRGYVVRVLDPNEIDFNYSGPTAFNGLEGEGRIEFQDAAKVRDAYRKAIKDDIDAVRKVAEEKGFRFILQRTDQPLENGLIKIYELSFQNRKNRTMPGLEL